MPILTGSVATKCVATMKSNWKHVLTEQTLGIFESYANAFEAASVHVLASITINGGVIIGGLAPPGGPLVGGICSFAPSSALAGSALQLKEKYVPPSFKMVHGGKTYQGSYTNWAKALTETLDSVVASAFTSWVSAWTLPGAPIAVGGICAWIPPTPVSPPAPGPWTLGTITPFGFSASGFGMSASLAFQQLDSTFISLAKSKSVGVSIGSKTQYIKLCSDPSKEDLLRSIALGISAGLDLAVKSMTVYDPLGTGASGLALPLGVISGGTISGCKLQ